MPTGPAAVTAVGGQGQTATVGRKLDDMLEVLVEDADGQPVAGTAVGWSVQSGGGTLSPQSSSTGSDGVAATTWTLGPGAGSQSVQAAVSGLQPVTFTATATEPQPFAPSRDTTLEGATTVGEVTIPEGVTVTLTGETALTASGAVTIAGALTGDCTPAKLHGQADVTIRGTVNTTCATPPDSDADLPMLMIVSEGLLTFDSATITSGGDLMVGNPDALAAVSAGAPALAAGASAQGAGCAFPTGGQFRATTFEGIQAPPGQAGIRGGDLTVGCDGDVPIGGDLEFFAGNGEDGAWESDGTTTLGLPGGAGGRVTLTTSGGILDAGVTPTKIRIVVGDGGDGGPAIAQSDDPALKAMATGGKGGDLGSLTLSDPIGGDQSTMSMDISMGLAGEGGRAEAHAADGTLDHRDGGDAEAHGGPGGDGSGTVPDAVGLSDAEISIGRPRGGRGGDGKAVGGNGREGSAAHPDGGDAGSLTATGGPGGSVTDDQGFPGDGGSILFESNHGGKGVDGCLAFGPGGNGGKGGDMAGSPGLGGGGRPDSPFGGPGSIIFQFVGNGGVGGDGNGPGLGGQAGADGAYSLDALSEIDGKDSSFQPGEDGSLCQVQSDVSLSVTSDPNGHEPYIGYTAIHTLTLEPGPDGMITFSSDNSTWVPLDGTMSDDYHFTASGTGTVAGYSNVRVSISGALTRDADGNVTGFSGTVRIDGSNLPEDYSYGHRDAVYQIDGTVQPPPQ